MTSSLDLFPTAHALTQAPPDLSSLSVLRSRQESSTLPDARHVSFVGRPDKKVVLVAFTDKPIEDLGKVISLKPLFMTPPGGWPSPTALVGRGATLDWAYVFDRNVDGRVDYMAYLYAAIPVKPDDFPADFPKGNRISTAEQYKLMLRQTRLIFTHYADDNFDGSTDSVIAAVADPDRRMWVDLCGVLRSTTCNGHVDDNWAFRTDIFTRIGTVAQEDGKYLLQNASGSRLSSARELFEFGTKTFERINDALAQCGLTEGALLPR